MTFSIIKRSKLWFIISGVIILAGILSMLTLGLNFGIDFTGGARIQATFPEGTTVGEIRELLNKIDISAGNLGNSFIQTHDAGEFSIRTFPLNNNDRSVVVNSFIEKFNISAEDMAVETVGPVVGQELLRNAMLSLLLAAALLIVYISIRFEFKFAVSAIIALMFDTFVVLSLFSLTQIELNREFVAAILTIVGYSINDTIVVFDRIRENLKLPGKDLAEKVDRSISQTMVRSINTSLTTLLVLGSLLFLGGDTIRPFALPLFFGIISGTYSSIFLASPIWTAWKMRGMNKKVA